MCLLYIRTKWSRKKSLAKQKPEKLALINKNCNLYYLLQLSFSEKSETMRLQLRWLFFSNNQFKNDLKRALRLIRPNKSLSSLFYELIKVFIVSRNEDFMCVIFSVVPPGFEYLYNG